MTGDTKPLANNVLNERLDLDFALKAARLGIWELDPATNRLNWDERCRDLFGLATDNPLTYEEAIRCIHPDDADRVDQAVRRALNPQLDGEYDLTYRTIGADDGLLRWVRFVGKAYFNESGTVYRFAGIAQDVTKEAEARQREEASDLLQAIFDSSSAGISVLSSVRDGAGAIIDFTYRLVNRVTEQTNNRTDLIGQRYSAVHSAYRQAGIFDDLVAAVETGNLIERERHYTGEGFDNWFATIAVKLDDGVVFSFRDITQEVKARETLNQNEQHLLQLTDTVPAIIWTTDPTGYCTYLNKQWYDYTGQTPEEAEGFGWLDATHPDDKEEAGRLFIEANDKQQPFSVLYRLRQQAGNYRWVIDKGSPHFTAAGIYEGIVGTVVDVHDQKLAEEEKRKLASIIEASREFIGMAGVDSRIQYCNPAALAMLGWDTVAERSILDCVYPDDRPLAEHLIQELIQTGYVSHEIRFINAKTGEPFWLQWSGVTIKDPATGDVIAQATVSPNITGRKKADQALRESEERFQSAIIALQGILWTNNAEGRMVGQQPGWAALTGQTYEEYQGYGWANAVHPDDAQPTIDAWQQALKERRTFVFEHRVRQHDGAWGVFSVRAIPLLNTSGVIREWVGVHTNITAPRRATQALAESEAQFRKLSDELDKQVLQRTQQLQESVLDLERSNRNLQQFAYIASHDLQEPLRKIQTFGDLLKSRFVNQSGIEVDYLDRMQVASSRMSTLIRDLLAFSRISTQRETTTRVDLTGVIQAVLLDLELVIDETGAQVTLNRLPTVTGDAAQLGQLFQNLLSNALKFRQEGSVPRVDVVGGWIAAVNLPDGVQPSREAEAYYRINVMDNGIGFDVKYLSRIFQVFQRLHGKSQYAGTGIGLAICEKVVANHGGAITARSTPGQGATFSVYLPV